MTSSLFIKKSTVSGTTPTLAEITSSELAINLGDGTLYYRNVTSSVVEPIRAGSASFAETASFALAGGDGGGGGGGVFGGDFSGTFSGSVTGAFTGSATGGLLGTASAADHALFAVTAAFAENAGGGGGGGGGSGDQFNYFDADAIPSGTLTSSLNDEFTETSLDPKWQPFNTGTVVRRFDGDSLFRFSTSDTTAEVSRYAQLVPSGSWVMRCKVSFEGPFSPEAYVGLFIENAVNSNIEQLSYGHGFTGDVPRKQIFLWTDPTTFSSVITEPAIDEEDQTSWAYFEIAYDGVNIDYRTSWDGLAFPELTATRTTASFLAGAPTRLGFMWFNNASPFSASIDWFRIATESADLNGALRTVGTIGPAGTSGSDGAAGADATGSGETFNYFDPDKVIFPSSSLNDEFTNSGSLDPKWEIQNSGSLSASLDGDSLLTMTNNLTGAGNPFISQPIPSGSWVIRSKMAFESFPDVARHTLGLALQNQVNDRVEMFILVSGVGGIGPGHHLLEFTDLLTFNSTIESVAHTALEMLEEYYLEIDYNGVDIGYRISRNGLGFDDAFVATRTTASFLSGAPTHFGILTGLSETDFTGSVDWFRIASSSADINGGLRSVGIGTEGPSGSTGPSGSAGPSGSSAPALSSIPTSPPTRSLLAWYEGGVGFTTSSGKITQWDDQSGNALHLTQSTVADQPALSSSLDIFNGVDYPAFDGSSQYMSVTMSAPVTASKLTIYEVHRQRFEDVDGSGIISLAQRNFNDAGVAGTYVLFLGADAQGPRTNLFRQNSVFLSEPAGFHNAQMWGLTNTSESWEAYRNGQLVDSGDDSAGIAVANFDIIYIAARQEVAATANEWNDIDFGEILIYEDTLTEVERTQVEEYLAAKFSIPILHNPQIAPASGSAGAQGPPGPSGSASNTGSFTSSFKGEFEGEGTGTFTGTFIGDFTGSNSFTGSFTGGLLGTSSVALDAVSASFAKSASFTETASFALNAGGLTNTGSFTGSFTGGFLGTASAADHALFAVTAAFAENAGAGAGAIVGDRFNYFDPDAIPAGTTTSSLNDEFNETSLDPKWEPFDTGSTVTKLSGNGLFEITTPTTAVQVRRYGQLVPSGSWIMRGKFAYQGPFTSEGYLGLFIENVSNSRLEQLSYGHGFTGGLPRKQLLLWTNSTTFASVPAEPAIDEEDQTSFAYIEIEYDGVNLDYRYSWDGVSFAPLLATRTTGSHLLGAPTRLGIMYYNDSGGEPFSGSVDWFRVTTGSREELGGALRIVGSATGAIGPSGSVGPSGSIGPSGSAAPAISSIPTSPPTRSLLAHYEGGVGFTTASGKISRWADQSGNGLDMTQSVAAAQPALSSSFDVFNSIEHPSFDGTDDFLEATMSAMVTSSQFTWYEVHRQRNKSGGATGFGITVFTRRDQIDSSAAGNYVWFAGIPATTTRLFRVGTTLIAEPVGWSHDVQMWGVSNTSESWQAHRNGKLVDSGIDADGIAAAGFNNIYIGARQTVAFTPDGFNDMDLAELIVYEDALTEVERTQVEEYLAGKYNIPIAHDPQIAPASGSAGATGPAGPAGPGVFGGDFSGSFSGSVTGTFVGELEATGTLTGTLSGSASFAENASAAVLAVSAVTAITSSNANTASFADPSLFTAHRPIKTIANTNPYNVVFEDYVLLIDASSGTLPIDVILPGTSVFMKGPSGKQITITKADAGANNVQVLASGSETIIGLATQSITDQYQGLTLHPSGNIWWIV